VDVEDAKRAAGERAAALVEDGMRLGLGTGSTARWFIEAVGRLVHSGMRLSGVPTSVASEALAREHGIPIVELDARGLDLAVDGADAVDPDLRLIKGAGGAHLREKIVAAASRRFVVVVDEGKLVARLTGRLPVEIVNFGAPAILASVASATGVEPAIRLGAHGGPTLTDTGNLIADCPMGQIDDPEGLADRLASIPGVVEHGLFLGMADLVIVATENGAVRVIQAGG
jgi:ribose 5-phosphate isomerase A